MTVILISINMVKLQESLNPLIMKNMFYFLEMYLKWYALKNKIKSE